MIGTANKIGDEIKYIVDPITSALSLDSFVDNIAGETLNRYFNKYFRISTEGLYFSDYRVLSNYNLTLIEIQYKHSYVIEILYVRAGSDNTGTLILNSIQINSINVAIDNGYEFNHSNFIKFFNSDNAEVEKWTLNVLRKIFLPGELAIYIERGKDVSDIIDNSLPSNRQFEDLSFHLWENGLQADFN